MFNIFWVGKYGGFRMFDVRCTQCRTIPLIMGSACNIPNLGPITMMHHWFCYILPFWMYDCNVGCGIIGKSGGMLVWDFCWGWSVAPNKDEQRHHHVPHASPSSDFVATCANKEHARYGRTGAPISKIRGVCLHQPLHHGDIPWLSSVEHHWARVSSTQYWVHLTQDQCLDPLRVPGFLWQTESASKSVG